MSVGHAVVVGGGFSGALQALNLVEAGVPRVTLIERSGMPGRGVAYGAAGEEHLLNVRAPGMSALPDDPDHFSRWLEARGDDPDGFAQRRVYGAYVTQLLARASERICILSGEALDVVRGPSGETVLLRGGDEISADAVVLAVGNLAPADIPALSGAPEGVYVADPWSADVAAGLEADDAVLLIGTGLTAVDVGQTLDREGFKGRIVALSRRGLSPRAHAERAEIPAAEADVPAHCAGLLRQVRLAARTIGWRAAVDQLRPITQQLWASASATERRRFLRHLRPWWDVHRHRIAPSIAERLDQMQEEGRLHLAAGKIVSVEPSGGQALIRWRPRGGEADQSLVARRIVNCTGPEANIVRAGEPLLDNLIAGGRIRPDVCRIGIDVDPGCGTIGGAGEISESLFAIGPMTRGAFWEIVAVPDIRVQVQALARRLAS